MSLGVPGRSVVNEFEKFGFEIVRWRVALSSCLWALSLLVPLPGMKPLDGVRPNSSVSESARLSVGSVLLLLRVNSLAIAPSIAPNCPSQQMANVPGTVGDKMSGEECFVVGGSSGGR